jgi:hypothetical protein
MRQVEPRGTSWGRLKVVHGGRRRNRVQPNGWRRRASAIRDHLGRTPGSPPPMASKAIWIVALLR